MRRLVRGTVVMTAAAVLALGGAAPALAAGGGGPSANWIGQCSGFTDIQARKTWGYCDGNNGAKFRVWMECSNPLLPWNYFVFGEWKLAGGGVSSYTSCGGGYVDSGIDKFETEPV